MAAYRKQLMAIGTVVRIRTQKDFVEEGVVVGFRVMPEPVGVEYLVTWIGHNEDYDKQDQVKTTTLWEPAAELMNQR